MCSWEHGRGIEKQDGCEGTECFCVQDQNGQKELNKAGLAAHTAEYQASKANVSAARQEASAEASAAAAVAHAQTQDVTAHRTAASTAQQQESVAFPVASALPEHSGVDRAAASTGQEDPRTHMPAVPECGKQTRAKSTRAGIRHQKSSGARAVTSRLVDHVHSRMQLANAVQQTGTDVAATVATTPVAAEHSRADTSLGGICEQKESGARAVTSRRVEHDIALTLLPSTQQLVGPVVKHVASTDADCVQADKQCPMHSKPTGSVAHSEQLQVAAPSISGQQQTASRAAAGSSNNAAPAKAQQEAASQAQQKGCATADVEPAEVSSAANAVNNSIGNKQVMSHKAVEAAAEEAGVEPVEVAVRKAVEIAVQEAGRKAACHKSIRELLWLSKVQCSFMCRSACVVLVARQVYKFKLWY